MKLHHFAVVALAGLLFTGPALSQEQPVVKLVPAGVTKEAIQARITELEKEQRQMEANANALSGAIQDCKYWLAELEAAEKAKAEEAKKAKPADTGTLLKTPIGMEDLPLGTEEAVKK